MKLLVTGASGFIGSALVKNLSEQTRWQIVAAIHRQRPVLPMGVEGVQINGIEGSTDWSSILSDVKTVVHLAARVHVMSESANNPLAEFRNINVVGTLNLARQAAKAGVERFVYLSSVKVNGETTAPGCFFSEVDIPAPRDAYGVSKHEAEKNLCQLARESGMAVTIIRPPLVYGACVKANFRQMLMWLNRGIPLPLGAVNNRRSLVALENLVDFIRTCIEHPMAANQTFLVADGEDISTTELLRRAGEALGKPARLFPVPTRLLVLISTLLGQKARADRLCRSLQLDTSKARNLLGWTPPLTVDEGLRLAVKGIRAEKL